MSKPDEEIEIKAGVDAATLARLRRHRSLPPATRGRARTDRLHTVYYDASDFRLMRAGLFLRMRRQGGQWEQTVKAGRRAGAGIQRVTEITDAAGNGEPDLQRISDATLRNRIHETLSGAPLEPACQSEVQRTTRILDSPLGQVELAFDDGKVIAGDAVDRFCEVEIECLHGGAAPAWEWAKTLLAGEAARLVQPSKAARGFTLAMSACPLRCKVMHSDINSLGPQPDARSAFTETLALLARAVAENIYCVMTQDDPHGPHQLRVSLRRLRAILRLFDHVLTDEFYALSRRARDIGRIVGRLRDADVLTAQLRDGLTVDDPLHAALAAWLETTRSGVRRDLKSAGATGFTVDLLRLADQSSWMPGKKRHRKLLAGSLSDLVGPALEIRWRQTCRRGGSPGKMKAGKRHKLRKNLKMLRYMLEVASLDAKKTPSPKIIAALEKLQDALGALNDADNLYRHGINFEEKALSNALKRRVETLRAQNEKLKRKELKSAKRAWGTLKRHWPR